MLAASTSFSARAFCPRAACQPGCSAWHRQLARRRSQARLLGWLVPAVHGRSHLQRPLVAVSCVEKQARALDWSSDSPAEHEERQRRLLERSVDEVEGLAPAITTATSVVCALQNCQALLARACVCLLRTAWRAGASPSRAGGSNSVGGPTEVGERVDEEEERHKDRRCTQLASDCQSCQHRGGDEVTAHSPRRGGAAERPVPKEKKKKGRQQQKRKRAHSHGRAMRHGWCEERG